MAVSWQRTVWGVLGGIFLWLLLAFSLGLYYTVTYYGRSGLPMPTPEGCGALIVYYFSVMNVSTPIQAVHWMIVYPVVGMLWVWMLSLTGPYYGGRNEAFGWSLFLFALATIPLLLPAPYLVYVAGTAEGGPWSLGEMVQVCLRRNSVSPWWWLNPLYLACGILALIWHLLVYRRVFRVQGGKAWRHLLVNAIIYCLFLVGLGFTLSWSLRYYLGSEPFFNLPY